MYSLLYLIPLPLKGSGFLNDLILAAAAPNFSLFILVSLIKFCLGHSIFTSDGMSKLISWLYPSSSFSFVPDTLAL